MTTEILELVYNLGFVAKMNGGVRRALHDRKFCEAYDKYIDDDAELEQSYIMMDEWYRGYDSCSSEYQKYRRAR